MFANRERTKPVLNWQIKPFDQLSPYDCWSALHLRQQVFVLEQTCLFPEIDQHDWPSHHLLGWDPIASSKCGQEFSSGESVMPADTDRPALRAYLRVIPPQIKFPEASLSRIVVDSAMRNTGLGHRLVELGIQHCQRLYPASGIQIAAQAHLEKFYARHGFAACSAPYLEDDILHVNMRLC